MMRYHVSCESEVSASTWQIASEPGADQFKVSETLSNVAGAFTVADTRGGTPTEARPRRTWRHRTFDLFRCGELVAVVRTSLRSGIRAEFVWEMPGPDTLELRGQFAELNFRFVRGARTVGMVSTLEEQETGFYVEALPCEDQSLILAAALAVRCLCAEACEAHERPMRPVVAVAARTGARAVG